MMLNESRYADIPAELRELLERSGYREYPCREWHRDALFQKGFRDSVGKRYTIELWGFAPADEDDPRYESGGGYWKSWRWMAEIHASIDRALLCFEQHHICLDTPEHLEAMEARVLAFWNTMGQPYYEKWAPEEPMDAAPDLQNRTSAD